MPKPSKKRTAGKNVPSASTLTPLIGVNISPTNAPVSPVNASAPSPARNHLSIQNTPYPPQDQAFLDLLIKDHPQFRFRLHQKRFSFRNSTIFIGPPQPYFALLTLHELGHALCGHKDYTLHVERLKIESAAWQRAKTVLENYQKQARLAPTHSSAPNISFATAPRQPSATPSHQLPSLASILPSWNQDFVESQLDSYRDWLHAKSKCKTCGLTRYQDQNGKYHCPFCDTFRK